MNRITLNVQVPEQGAYVLLVVNGVLVHEPIPVIISSKPFEREDGTLIKVLRNAEPVEVQTVDGQRYLAYRIFLNPDKLEPADASQLFVLK